MGNFQLARHALLTACAILGCRLIIALTLVPPWQQPDEPTHVALIERYRLPAPAPAGGRPSGREDEILQSMTRHRWWEHRASDFRRPAELPETFGFRVGVPSDTYTRPPLYALVYGWALSWLPRMSLIEDLYLLRGASAALGLLTLWVAWLAARDVLGVLGGAVVAGLVALHPQFAIASTAASPDPIATFLGACVWWQATLAVTRTRIRLVFAGMWVSAFAAASIDRTGLPLLAIAVVISLVVIARRMRSPWRLSRPMLAAAVSGVMVLAAACWVVVSAFGGTYGLDWVFGRGLTPVPGVLTWDGFIRFTWRLHEGWWYAIGWGRYTAPQWWIGVATFVSVLALVGVGRRWGRDTTIDPRTRTLLGLAVIAVAIQLASVYWTYFRLGTGGQGRYLFPVLVPSMFLLWTGVESWASSGPQRAAAAAALILAVAALDVTAWVVVAIPAYYASF